MNKLDATLLAPPENDELTQEIYSNELKTFFKNEFILKCIKIKFDAKENKNFEKVLLYLNLDECLEFKNQAADDCRLLGLNLSWKNIDLAYTEKKQLRHFVESQLIQESKNIQKFNSEDPIGKLQKTREKLLELEAKRKELSEKVVELKKNKESLLKQCADFRLGNSQKNLVEILHAKAEVNEIKAKSIKDVCIHDIISRNAFTQKAIKEVEANLDKILKIK